MAIRLSGINSGLDTDALVKELVSAYSLKTEKYEKQKTKLEWKKESWQGMNTKIYGLYTNISNLRYDSAYALKKTNVSDATKASVKASATAASGTQKLSVLSTAQACYITGGKLEDDVEGSTKLKDLGLVGTTTLKITRNGQSEDVTISEDDTVSGLMKKLSEKDLNANFDENNNRVYISAKESGADANFTLESDDVVGKAVLSALGLNNASQEVASLNARVEAYQEDLDEWADYVDGYTDEAAAISAYKGMIEAYNQKQAHYLASDALKNIVDASADKTVDTEKLLEFANKEEATVDEIKTYLSENGFSDAELKNIDAHIKTIAEYSAAKNGEIKDADITQEAIENMTAELTSETSVLKENYDTATEALTIKAKIDAAYENADVRAIIDSNGTTTAESVIAAKTGTKFATRIEGTDAKIILNDVEYTSNSNSFSINGLNIEAYAVTTTGEGNNKVDNPITITTATDTQGIYDKIKDFLTEYNNVINEITKSYNADSAGDYEPLTDEEKDAMSETEVEKWEKKIKDSLLRRDTSLGVVMNAMTNTMAQTIEIDGKKLSLSNFGISTLGFLNSAKNEQYAYHIDGDEDDSATSGKTDKLMAAIQNDPEQVIKFMKQLTTNLHKAIDDKMKSTELSSAYKVYNDKEMDNELKDIEEVIKKWKDKVADEEDRYYKQFSNMEVALSKLQSQTNALAGLLGQ